MRNINKIIIIIVLLNINFYLSYGQENCKTYEWKCNNNECIEDNELCDGHKHCSDGSDEISESCLHLICPSFSFKCAYGACVSGSSKCNKIKDCDDNSDEAASLCVNCPEDSFKCTNSECISNELACDGKNHCKDGSDETHLCKISYCPVFSFRCGYGACISGDKKCNGITDCIDGSDENAAICGNTTEIPTTSTEKPILPIVDTGCQTTNIPNLIVKTNGDNPQEILPGEYVPNYQEITYSCQQRYLLTGTKKNSCLNSKWNEPVPACTDAGCRVPYIQNLITTSEGEIKAVLPGDYVNNFKAIVYSCQPGHLLEGTKKNSCLNSKWSEPLPACIRITTIPNTGCRVPYSQNLIATSEGENPKEVFPGDYVNDFEAIVYSCQPRHLLQGIQKNYCFNSTWSSEPLPTCIKYCDNNDLQSATIQTACEYNGARVSCDMPILPNTRVTITCQFGYQRPLLNARDNIVCQMNGQWNFPPYRCNQVCGEEPATLRAFIINGSKVNNTKVPWHVGIYSSIDKPNEQICGGTIITAKLVISAAHCFWNSSAAQKNDAIYYKIGAGKYYRVYTAKEPLPVQFIDISEIHTSVGYKDIQLSYINDIAVLVLKSYLKFTSYIQPACLVWVQYREQAMKSNLIGRVAGWGTTATGLPSNELNAIEISTLSYDDCVAKTERDYQNLITGDKFCASSENSQTVCRGDSGGGFLIPARIDGVKRYVLQGIVSNGINSNNECTGDFLTAYTNIQYYKQMVEEYKEKFEVV